jgi:3-dehydroquinate dehydratase II
MKKVLIIHGPNMNYIGLKSAKDGSRITIDKIDRAIRRKAKVLNLDIKFLRSHDEAKAVTFIQRNRKIALGLVISPSSWHKGGFTLSDTVHFLEIPYSTVSLEKVDNSLFNKGADFNNENVILSYENALENIHQLIL